MIARLLSLENLVFLAGLLQFCQIPAMLCSPKMLGWEEDLAKLSAINRRIVFVMGGGIILTVVGSGIVVVAASSEIAAGGRLGAALACFLGVLWLYRGSMQVVVYSRIWPGGFLGRLSHHGLVALFTFQSAVYFAAFAAALLRSR